MSSEPPSPDLLDPSEAPSLPDEPPLPAQLPSVTVPLPVTQEQQQQQSIRLPSPSPDAFAGPKDGSTLMNILRPDLARAVEQQWGWKRSPDAPAPAPPPPLEPPCTPTPPRDTSYTWIPQDVMPEKRTVHGHPLPSHLSDVADKVIHFLAPVDTRSAYRFLYWLPAADQQKVLHRGPLDSVANPSAVLEKRMQGAFRGGLVPPVEAIIAENSLRPEYADRLRQLSSTVWRKVMQCGTLDRVNNPEAVLEKRIVQMQEQTKQEATAHYGHVLSMIGEMGMAASFRPASSLAPPPPRLVPPPAPPFHPAPSTRPSELPAPSTHPAPRPPVPSEPSAPSTRHLVYSEPPAPSTRLHPPAPRPPVPSEPSAPSTRPPVSSEPPARQPALPQVRNVPRDARRALARWCISKQEDSKVPLDLLLEALASQHPSRPSNESLAAQILPGKVKEDTGSSQSTPSSAIFSSPGSRTSQLEDEVIIQGPPPKRPRRAPPTPTTRNDRVYYDVDAESTDDLLSDTEEDALLVPSTLAPQRQGAATMSYVPPTPPVDTPESPDSGDTDSSLGNIPPRKMFAMVQAVQQMWRKWTADGR